MKKIVVVCALMMVGVSLAACGDKKESTEETNEGVKVDTDSMKGQQVITENGEEATQFTMDDGTVMQENNQKE